MINNQKKELRVQTFQFGTQLSRFITISKTYWTFDRKHVYFVECSVFICEQTVGFPMLRIVHLY